MDTRILILTPKDLRPAKKLLRPRKSRGIKNVAILDFQGPILPFYSSDIIVYQMKDRYKILKHRFATPGGIKKGNFPLTDIPLPAKVVGLKNYKILKSLLDKGVR